MPRNPFVTNAAATPNVVVPPYNDLLGFVHHMRVVTVQLQNLLEAARDTNDPVTCLDKVTEACDRADAMRLKYQLAGFPLVLEWTPELSAIAARDGWGVFTNSEASPEIQKCDDHERFAEDSDAITHVYWAAGTGDVTAQIALALTMHGPWQYNADITYPKTGPIKAEG